VADCRRTQRKRKYQTCDLGAAHIRYPLLHPYYVFVAGSSLILMP
jgi:hypothetical protein